MDNSLSTPVVEIRHLTIGYNSRPAISDLSLAIPRGAMVAIVGPNGAGKSTLFKALVGLIPTASGETLIDGQPARDRLERIAYVPQREEVDWRFPVSVLDVVLMGRFGRLGWLRRPGAAEAGAQAGAQPVPVGKGEEGPGLRPPFPVGAQQGGVDAVHGGAAHQPDDGVDNAVHEGLRLAPRRRPGNCGGGGSMLTDATQNATTTAGPRP